MGNRERGMGSEVVGESDGGLSLGRGLVGGGRERE